MALREVRTIGDPILEKRSKEVTKVTDRTKELIDDMIETLYEQNGVGLSAVQVGVLKRIVIMDLSEGQLSITQTAAGFPEKGSFVNASTIYCFISVSPSKY